MSIKNLKITHKQAAAFGAIIATIVALGVVVLFNLRAIESARQANDHSYEVLRTIAGVEFSLARQENSFRGVLLSGDAYYTERVQKHRGTFLGHLKTLRDLQRDDAEAQKLIDALQAASDGWFERVVVEGSRLAQDPLTHPVAVQMVGPSGIADEQIAPAETAIEKMVEMEEARLKQRLAAMATANRTVDLVVAGGVGLTILIALAAGFLLARTVAAPVVAMTAAMRRLAEGDNSVEIPAADRSDEIGQMAGAVQVFKDAAIEKLRLEAEAAEQRRQAEAERAERERQKAEEAAADAVAISSLAEGLSRLASGDLTYRITAAFAPKAEQLKTDFNGAMDQLQETMKVITAATQGLRSGSGEISQAADDLSKRTEQQAASLEETAAALDEITATVRKTAEGAHHARDVVSTAKSDGEQSGEIVRQAVAAMSEIEKSAQQISQIIGVIDEIAFQTNLLALNAGVEAARAGDAGKGFAVVASEVRALAQRSADAAKEIKTLISASTQQVGSGVSLVGEAGEALNRIVAQVADINNVVSEIAASAQEQATGLNQVNTAVNQMDQLTQQNAAMVEQSTAASHSLSSEAEELARLIGRFSVGEAAVQSPAATPRAPAPRTAMKTVSTHARGGGAALKPQPLAEADNWEEF
ncbi:methyl-accepting chemotaxis protein McpA [Phenylobacterium zucineum HLK1]|uniref:Methyl-accepting chemotaxis protein McpA n=1 Tax=Phenylobacterium zucineum (strain HLK1) TaxID=450851 RepID=B4RBE6_PHEZH|nr:methyl-accepting chemotaxis protein [Phenylobacterium zucineum]ACG79791.1 methyl-accepting chemotaxis protein McpA [Phenylobacterium zucineum HLK1]